MEISFGQTYWGLILLTSITIAAAVTFFLYHKNPANRELTATQRRLLMFLRFLSIFFVAFLFTNPLIKSLKKVSRPPTLILAVDNSQSMNGFDGNGSQKMVAESTLAKIIDGFKNKFDIIVYTFGESTRKNTNAGFTEKNSDYGDMLRKILDLHFNENTGGLIVLGDGIYNKGENPVNACKKYPYPVYTVGFGDTTILRDARVAAVKVNNTAFLGNKFPAEIDVKVQGFQGKNINVSITDRTEEIYSQNFQVNGSDFFLTIPALLDATRKGIQHYTVKLGVLEGEKNKENNVWTFAINILENKQKIVIISNGSHPDAGAIKYALEKQINYDVSLFSAAPYPTGMKDVNLFIVNQLPSSGESGKLIFEESANNRIPVLLLVGTQTFLPQLNLMLPGVEILPQAGSFEEAQISFNEQFVSFTVSEALKENLEKYPPLKVPFARYSLDPSYRVLAYQKIKNIVTPWPAIAVGTISGRKTGIIFGEGIWRWRMSNYLNTQSHAEFSELIDKLVQFLALRDNSDNFNVEFRPVYHETENIVFNAEVYNDSYELINTPEVFMTVSDSTGREFKYSFDRTSGFYHLDAGIFPPGDYGFYARVALGTKEYQESGDFTVMPVNAEKLETRADHRLLSLLSWETNGGFFLPGQTDQLIHSVLNNQSIKTVNYFQTVLNELINLRWIFFLLLLVLSSEWFLRKFWGIY